MTERIDNVVYLPPPKELSPEQIAHWEAYLEQCERGRENALRVLGRLGIEEGTKE